MSLRIQTIKVTTTGGDGAASGNADSAVIVGEILGIFANYHASTPATADVTIKAVNPVDHNILVITDNATDGYYAPRIVPVTSSNVAITNAHTPYIVAGKINVALAQGNALTDAVVVHILYRD